MQPDLPIWIDGSSAAAVGARRAMAQDGRRGGTPADVRRVIGEIKAAVVEAGRSIDEDHYGAAFAYHFGHRRSGVAQVMEASQTPVAIRNHFAIGVPG